MLSETWALRASLSASFWPIKRGREREIIFEEESKILRVIRVKIREIRF